MGYKVEISDIVLKKLKKMDKPVVALIIGYIEKNLVNWENPRAFGKAINGNHKNKWGYRVGDYCLLTYIENDKVIITVIEIEHRKDIYKH